MAQTSSQASQSYPVVPYVANRVGTAYLLWVVAFIVPIAGLHRFYNKKYASGLLWFCTWGFFGIGQFLDLFFIPGMVEEHNLKQQMRLGLSPYGYYPQQPTVQRVVDVPVVEPPMTLEEKMLKLLKAAQQRKGTISVTQAVLDTELSFGEVEETLKQMMKMGYVQVGNDFETGIVTYHFTELS
jgi:TM2 domain-containing membrane protein YozV